MSFSPTIGRFLEMDPDTDIDGPNEYQFDGSNPINRVDPTGTNWYTWTVASATAKLAAQLAAWRAKPGYGLQANLLAHFLGNSGTLYKCNDHPADLNQIKNDPDMSGTVNELIYRAVTNQDPNSGWGFNQKPFNKTTPFKFKITDDHYFNPTTDMFWAFASLHIVIDGYAVEDCEGWTYYAHVTFSKNWNFNASTHSSLDDAFPTFDAGQFLQNNGGGKAFGLNGWYTLHGKI
jgi:hypothetical protein